MSVTHLEVITKEAVVFAVDALAQEVDIEPNGDPRTKKQVAS